MEYTITMAEVCELAHIYTMIEYKEKNITIYKKENKYQSGYTREAQKIFDKHYKLITKTLCV